MDIHAIRLRQSAITSLILFLVFLTLPYVPDNFQLVHNLVVIVLGLDAVVKLLFSETPFRVLSSVLYSFALAVAFATYFQLFGYPFSYIAALLFFVDAVLKLVPGDQRILFIDEYKLRHYWSALVTILLGLALMFSYTFITPILSVLAGIFLVYDGVTKWVYVSEI